MKIKPSELSRKHIGMVCVVRFSTTGTGFVGHSHAYGLESGSVSTSYILVGRLCEVTDEELLFLNSYYSHHALDLSWRLGPQYEDSNYIHVVRREKLSEKRPIVLNYREKSNAVQQHLLKSNKSTFWNSGHILAAHLKFQ